MAMPADRTDWTVEMLDALPDDGQRYELIDGELFVTPAPSDLRWGRVLRDRATYSAADTKRVLQVSAAAAAGEPLLQGGSPISCGR